VRRRLIRLASDEAPASDGPPRIEVISVVIQVEGLLLDIAAWAEMVDVVEARGPPAGVV
jgi:hypothetical protein